jgi:hypothetical protein
VPFDECQQQLGGLGRQRHDLLATAEQALVFLYAERPELVELLSLFHGQETFVRTTSELPKDSDPAAPILFAAGRSPRILSHGVAFDRSVRP